MRKIPQKLFFPAAVFLIFLSDAHSQDFPKYEIHGGYSYTHMGDRDWFGWQISATRNFNHYFGVAFNFLVLDASKTESVFFHDFETDARRYYFLAGPKFADRSWKKWIPYVHFLVGASKTAISYQYQLDDQTLITGVSKKNSFAMMVGVGFNYKINRSFIVHMVQGNFIRNLVNDPWDKWEDGGMISFGLEYDW
jgi:hypothetical protein